MKGLTICLQRQMSTLRSYSAGTLFPQGCGFSREALHLTHLLQRPRARRDLDKLNVSHPLFHLISSFEIMAYSCIFALGSEGTDQLLSRHRKQGQMSTLLLLSQYRPNFIGILLKSCRYLDEVKTEAFLGSGYRQVLLFPSG